MLAKEKPPEAEDIAAIIGYEIIWHKKSSLPIKVSCFFVYNFFILRYQSRGRFKLASACRFIWNKNTATHPKAQMRYDEFPLSYFR